METICCPQHLAMSYESGTKGLNREQVERMGEEGRRRRDAPWWEKPRLFCSKNAPKLSTWVSKAIARLIPCCAVFLFAWNMSFLLLTTEGDTEIACPLTLEGEGSLRPLQNCAVLFCDVNRDDITCHRIRESQNHGAGRGL